MLIALASIILGIVFAFRAYSAGDNLKVAPMATENIRTAGILIATALALVLVGVVISFFMYGSMALKTPQNVIGSNIIFMILAFIVALLMIVALVYAWIAYTDAMNTPIAADTLIAAIAITVAIVSPFFSRGGVASVPILGDNVIVNAKVNLTDNVPGDVMSNDNNTDQSQDAASILIPKLPKKK